MKMAGNQNFNNIRLENTGDYLQIQAQNVKDDVGEKSLKIISCKKKKIIF